MPNLRQIFNSLKMISFLSLFIPIFSYAEEVDLPYCAEVSCPTTHESSGVPDLIQTVAFKGVRAGDSGEVVTVFAGDPGYKEWQRSVLKMPREVKGKVREAARANVEIFIQCSSAHSPVTLGRGKSITCPEGDGIFVRQDDPTCEDPATGPHGVVEITRVSKREQDEKVAALEARISELRIRKDELDAEHRVNERLISGFDRDLHESALRLAGGAMFGGSVGGGF